MQMLCKINQYQYSMHIISAKHRYFEHLIGYNSAANMSIKCFIYPTFCLLYPNNFVFIATTFVKN